MTITGKREALTAGLWTAALALGVGALLVTLDAALNSITGLENLKESFVRRRLLVHSGDEYRASAIEAARRG